MFGIEIIETKALDKLYADLDYARAELEAAQKKFQDENGRLVEVRDRQGESVDELIRMLSEAKKSADDWKHLYLSSEEARKSLSEKNKALSVMNGELRAKVEPLEEQLKHEREIYAALAVSYDELSASHEMVIKGLHDSTVEVE